VQHRTLGYKTLWCVRGTLLARHLEFLPLLLTTTLWYFPLDSLIVFTN
jgi:hypothetical protein